MLTATLLLLVGLLALGARPLPSSDEQKPIGTLHESSDHITFPDHLNQVKNAKFEDYKGCECDEEEFQAMKAHIQYMYEGVQKPAEVTSFVHGGLYGDCIWIKEQPTYHHLGLQEIAEPPPSSKPSEKAKGGVPGCSSRADSPLKKGAKDRFGNPISCPKGSIPMTRLTLEMLTKFRTLDDFFAKEPGVVRGKDVSTQQTWDGTHLHAYAYQSVNNFGGNSWLDLWNPQGDFSISQQWYVGGQGCNTQTVEGGWQVYPLKYGTNDAVLFIYWTNNDYNAAGCTPIANAGCYNLDCVGFHQTNNDWHLGAIWGEYSTLGGTQVGFEMQWKLYQGNWWLWLNSEPVGYYPTSIYNGGQLSEQATVIEYGGEVARLVGDVWPQMGSGQFAERGFEFASYQNTIFWITPEETGVWAELTKADEALPVCYTIELTDYPNGGSWGTYFFFGGSGAITCN